jgi:hypothetical protein
MVVCRRGNDAPVLDTNGNPDDHAFLNQKATNIFNRNLSEAQNYKVVSKPGAPNVYMVSRKNGRGNISGNNQAEEYIVFFNEEDKTCNCRCLANGINGAACKHIYAVIIKLDKRYIFHDEEKAAMLFHQCFFKKNLEAAYRLVINQTHGSSLKCDNMQGPVITSKSHLGKRIRSSHNRHQSKSSGVKISHCSKCGECGHNISSCEFKDYSDADMYIARRDSLERNSERPKSFIKVNLGVITTFSASRFCNIIIFA